MTSIPTVNDVVRDHMRRTAAQARSLFKHSVRPLYRARDDGRPECIGTGVLLEVEGIKYFATAAHVLDEASTGSLHLGGYPKLVPLNAEFTATGSRSSRSEDRVDVAVTKLSPDILEGLGRLPFIAHGDQMSQPGSAAGQGLLAMGYPHTKNKAPWWEKTDITPEILTYQSLLTSLPKRADEADDRGYNFALDLGKFGRRDGHKVKVPKLNGISGGGVFDLGPLPTIAQLSMPMTPRPKLAGLVIERTDEALICTEMSAVYLCIADLSRALG